MERRLKVMKLRWKKKATEKPQPRMTVIFLGREFASQWHILPGMVRGGGYIVQSVQLYGGHSREVILCSAFPPITLQLVCTINGAILVWGKTFITCTLWAMFSDILNSSSWDMHKHSARKQILMYWYSIADGMYGGMSQSCRVWLVIKPRDYESGGEVNSVKVNHGWWPTGGD